MPLSLIGGPFDGLKLSTGLVEAFLWTNGKRFFRAPARGRVLYRTFPGGEVAHFAGNKVALCACGAYRRRHEHCPLCGAEAVVA